MLTLNRISVLTFLIAAFLPLVAVKAADVAIKGAKPGVWTMDYDAALAAAKKNDCPIFLDFTGSDWCFWCKLMDRSVFSLAEWTDYAAKKGLYLVAIDFPRDASHIPAAYQTRNQKLQRKFQVSGYPTFIILDSDGKTRLGQLGASRNSTPKKFIKQVESVLRFRDKEIKQTIARLGKEKGARYQKTMQAFKAEKAKLEAWLKTRPQRTEENTAFYTNTVKKMNTLQKQLDAFTAVPTVKPVKVQKPRGSTTK